MKSVEIIELGDHSADENSPSQRYGHSTTQVGDFLYLFGGCSLDGKTFHKDLNVFDLINMKWIKTVTTADEKIDGRHFHTCCVTSSDPTEAKLIFFGGKSNGYRNDVFSFDIATEKWIVFEHRFKNEKNLSSCVNKDLHPPTPRYGHSSCYYNDRMFIFGGYDKNAFSKNDLYCFNFKKNMWRRFIVAKIPRRFHHSGVLQGSNYFILGGITSSLKPLSDVYRFDLSQLSVMKNNTIKQEEEEEEEEEEDDDDDHAIEAFELTIENPIASYGHKCFFWEDNIYQFGGRNTQQEFRHLLRLEQGKGNLRWVIDEEKNKDLFTTDENENINDRLLFMSYGSINIFQNKLLFFGGQAKKNIRINSIKKEKEEENEGEEEEEIIDSDRLPYDTIFEILSFLNERDLIRVCIVSKKWTISIAARSDRIWLKKYELAMSMTRIHPYDIKQVKRRKTTYEKYCTLRSKEMIMNLHTVRSYSSKNVKVRGGRDIDNIKITIIGDGAVGKTCLLIVFASEDNKFPTEYIPTVFDLYNYSVKVDGKDVGVGIWDTAGEEDYDELKPLQYCGTHIFFICASVAGPVSLSNIQANWVREMRRYEKKAPFFIVLTKSDLRNDLQTEEELKDCNQEFVKFDDAVKMAERVGASGVYECSSLTGKGVEKVFKDAINLVMFGSTSGDKCGIM